MPVYATAPWPPISVAERPLLNSLARRCAINYLSIFCRELLIYRPSRPRYVPCLAGSFDLAVPPRSPLSGRYAYLRFLKGPLSLSSLVSIRLPLSRFPVLFCGLIRHSNRRSSALDGRSGTSARTGLCRRAAHAFILSRALDASMADLSRFD